MDEIDEKRKDPFSPPSRLGYTLKESPSLVLLSCHGQIFSVSTAVFLRAHCIYPLPPSEQTEKSKKEMGTFTKPSGLPTFTCSSNPLTYQPDRFSCSCPPPFSLPHVLPTLPFQQSGPRWFLCSRSHRSNQGVKLI